MPTHNDLVVMATTVHAHFSPTRETLQLKKYVRALQICSRRTALECCGA